MSLVAEPLDKKFLTLDTGKGKPERIPALDSRWKEHVQFLVYQAPPQDRHDHGLVEEWIDRLKFIVEDLHWLLQLQHDKFWCQVVFDETLQNLLDTYLKLAPRNHDTMVLHTLPADTKEHHDEVHKLVFMVFLRMATYKESKEYHITPSVFGNILYENFLFDLPKLLDLCVLYGPGNGPLLNKMINNIFTQQPKYNEDLSMTIPTVLQVFENVREKCGIRDSGSMSPKKLSSPKSENSSLKTMSIDKLQDLVLYLADIGMTLANFLEVYSPACLIFYRHGFLSQLASFYESVIPEIVAVIKQRDFDTPGQKHILRQETHKAKSSLLKVVHLLVTQCFIQPVLENSSAEESVEEFIQTFSDLLNEKRFLADFESRFRFQEYTEILSQSQVHIDETRINYVQDAINTAFATYGRRRKPTGGTNRGGRTSPDGSPGEESQAVGGAVAAAAVGGAQGAEPEESYGAELGACASRKSGIELESLISSVKDLLPDLGEGFIEVCLEEFDYNIERVINVVLEDKLPPSLQDLDKTMARDTEAPAEPPPASLLEGRRNVFDHDEFDVFSRDSVDTSRIFHGKKDKTDTVDLDTDLKDDIKSRMTEAYGYHTVEVDADDMTQMTELYDDEYDDTYDVNNVGADDADSADELQYRRPFIQPRILGLQNEDRKTSSRESESEESEEEDSRPKDEFVANPAILRQRAEERYQSKMQRRGQGQRHRQPHLPSTQAEGQQQGKTYDVKGKAKGHGQEEDVLRNRRWKEKHKSSRGNHNRRFMSDKKRMGFP